MKNLITATFFTFAALTAEDAPQKPAASDVMATPEELRDAVIKGDKLKLAELIRRDKRLVNITDNNGYTPLMYASARGDAEATLQLLAAGADVHARSDKGKTALMLASLAPKNIGVKPAELLLEAEARIDDKTPDNNMTALHLAITAMNFDMVMLLLNKGANPNAPYISKVQRNDDGAVMHVRGYTPLMLASDIGDDAINFSLVLLKSGGDPAQKNEHGEDAYDHAQMYAPRTSKMLQKEAPKKKYYRPSIQFNF